MSEQHLCWWCSVVWVPDHPCNGDCADNDCAEPCECQEAHE